jgi:hypothetical protein
MKKKKSYDSTKMACAIDRKREIEAYGKLVSMRPSRVHRSKKAYNRKANKVLDDDML